MNKRCLLTILVGGCAAMSAFAQHTNDDKEWSVELNPVVVTGTGTHHRLKNTPAPVEVVTANDLKKAGITDFQQAMTMLVPSLSFSTNTMGSYLMMNGLSNKYVLILVDGKKMTGDTSNNIDLSRVDMNNVKRIEVLKGAGSALYGSDAIGGVINIITNNPINPLTITSNTKVEGYGQFTQGADVALNTKKFGSYTSYTRRQAEGWQLSPIEEDGKETDKNASDRYYSNVINQKFTFTPTEALSFYTEGGYFDRTVRRPQSPSTLYYDLNYDAFNLGVGAKYDLNKKSYIQFDLRNDNYDTNYEYFKENEGFKPGDESLVKRQHYYNANLKSLFRFTENTRTIFGLEYISESLERESFGVDKSAYTMAAYAQEEISFLKNFQAVIGLRYINHETAGSNVTPKVSLMYKLGNFSMRGQYSAGFRAPGLDELYKFSYSARKGKNGTLSIGDKDLKAEKSHYGSINLEYATGWMTASVTGYINSLRDMINGRTLLLKDLSAAEQEEMRNLATAADNGNADAGKNLQKITRFVNDEKALVKGIEVNLNSYLGAGFSLGGSYTFADARNKDIEEGWRDIERSVRHSGSVNANYIHSWKSYRLNVNVNGRIQSKRTHLTLNANEWEDESAPGFAQWNLNTKHTFDGWEYFTIEPGIGINNILDKVDKRPLGVNYFSLNPGRTIYASLLLRFKK